MTRVIQLRKTEQENKRRSSCVGTEAKKENRPFILFQKKDYLLLTSQYLKYSHVYLILDLMSPI